jgi:hypothetical protein
MVWLVSSIPDHPVILFPDTGVSTFFDDVRNQNYKNVSLMLT